MRTQELLAFMAERHEIHRRRQRGEPKPWTRNPNLRDWRYCNIYRELDTVTVWIAANWREPHSTDPDLWFALVVARLVNWPDSLEEIGYPVPWDPDRFVAAMNGRMQRGEKVFTGAYTIHANQGFKGTKAEYLAAKVLAPMWRAREALRRIVHGTLAGAHRTLIACHGMGSFMAGQVIADLKYVEPLRRAPDWRTWAAPGPGSQRGLNRVFGRPVDDPWEEPEWLRSLQALHKEILPLLTKARLPQMHAQDLQNCLCEWDKYERVRLGEGKPRNRYPGKV
jgi:hypothetical protein